MLANASVATLTLAILINLSCAVQPAVPAIVPNVAAQAPVLGAQIPAVPALSASSSMMPFLPVLGKSVLCRPLKNTYQPGARPERIDEILQHDIDAFIQRDGKSEHQSGVVVMLPATSLLKTPAQSTFRPEDLETIRKCLLFRERSIGATSFDLEMKGKGNNDVTAMAIGVATRMDAAQKSNPNSVSKQQMEEMLSYKTAASLLLRDIPSANGPNVMQKFKDASDVQDTNTDFCNALQFIHTLRQIVDQINVADCGRGSKDKCPPSILKIILNQTKRANDFKNAVCLSIYGDVDQCEYLSVQVDDLSATIWKHIQSFIDYLVKVKKCNPKKCALTEAETSLFMAQVEKDAIGQRSRVASQFNGANIVI